MIQTTRDRKYSHTETNIHTDTYVQTYIQTERHQTQTIRETYKQTYRRRETYKHKQSEIYIQPHTDRQPDIHTYI